MKNRAQTSEPHQLPGQWEHEEHVLVPSNNLMAVVEVTPASEKSRFFPRLRLPLQEKPDMDEEERDHFSVVSSRTHRLVHDNVSGTSQKINAFHRNKFKKVLFLPVSVKNKKKMKKSF